MRHLVLKIVVPNRVAETERRVACSRCAAPILAYRVVGAEKLCHKCEEDANLPAVPGVGYDFALCCHSREWLTDFFVKSGAPLAFSETAARRRFIAEPDPRLNKTDSKWFTHAWSDQVVGDPLAKRLASADCGECLVLWDQYVADGFFTVDRAPLEEIYPDRDSKVAAEARKERKVRLRGPAVALDATAAGIAEPRKKGGGK